MSGKRIEVVTSKKKRFLFFCLMADPPANIGAMIAECMQDPYGVPKSYVRVAHGTLV